jgi:hypothetical protein
MFGYTDLIVKGASRSPLKLGVGLEHAALSAIR